MILFFKERKQPQDRCLLGLFSFSYLATSALGGIKALWRRGGRAAAAAAGIVVVDGVGGGGDGLLGAAREPVQLGRGVVPDRGRFH